MGIQNYSKRTFGCDGGRRQKGMWEIGLGNNMNVLVMMGAITMEFFRRNKTMFLSLLYRRKEEGHGGIFCAAWDYGAISLADEEQHVAAC
eukprot:3195613-Ditylum_brightwellii.AAC.1